MRAITLIGAVLTSGAPASAAGVNVVPVQLAVPMDARVCLVE